MHKKLANKYITIAILLVSVLIITTLATSTVKPIIMNYIPTPNRRKPSIQTSAVPTKQTIQPTRKILANNISQKAHVYLILPKGWKYKEYYTLYGPYIPSVKIFNQNNNLILEITWSAGIGSSCHTKGLNAIPVFKFKDSDNANLQDNINCLTYKSHRPKIIPVGNYYKTSLFGREIRFIKNNGQFAVLISTNSMNKKDFSYDAIFPYVFLQPKPEEMNMYHIPDSNADLILGKHITTSDIDKLIKILPTIRFDYNAREKTNIVDK